MTIDWHVRFVQQAQWTKSLREYLLGKLDLNPSLRVLEVGCGTGAVLSDYLNAHSGLMHGLDLNFDYCKIAKNNTIHAHLVNGNVFNLPYAANSFDLVFCHYFLLWLPSLQPAMSEIRRALKPGAIFLIFAEPDYDARIDYPAPLQILGELQNTSLKNQGANAAIGRQLPASVSEAGFENVHFGVSGFEIAMNDLPEWRGLEWLVLENDLKFMIDPQRLSQLKALDRRSWLEGSRVLWVPTFYLSCNKPDD